MTNLSKLTEPFAGSRDLQITHESQIITIRQLYKYRWILVGVLILMSLLLVFFTVVITVKAISENKPRYIVGILLFLVFDIGAFYLIKKALFFRRILTLDLNKKTVTFQTSLKKLYQYQFDEIIQWQLVGEVYRGTRGGLFVNNKLYLRLKNEPTKHKPLMVFDFESSTQNWRKPTNSTLEVMKKNTAEKGQEVARRLQNITQIPWKWYGYNNKH